MALVSFEIDVEIQGATFDKDGYLWLSKSGSKMGKLQKVDPSNGRVLKEYELTNQPIIVWTLKTKSLLPSLYKREELPLFGRRPVGLWPGGQRGVRGDFQNNMSFQLWTP